MAFLDLVRRGTLTIAVERFDPTAGIGFDLFLLVDSVAISRGIQQQDRTIKLPANAQEAEQGAVLVDGL